MKKSDNMTQEILGLEKKYWKAMQEQDLKTALDLTDFPCVVAGAHGIQFVDEKKFEQMFNSKDQDSIQSFDFDQSKAQVRLLNPETAIVAYQIQTSFTHEGKERHLKAIDTSTWIKRGNKWVCAMHTEMEMLEQ